MIFAAVAIREGFEGGIAPLSPLTVTVATLGPLLAVCVLVDAWMRLAWRTLALTGDVRTVVRADAVLRLSQIAIAMIHGVAVLVLGWLDVVRAAVGDVVVLDEALAVLPALLAGIAGWWSHAPIALAARESSLIGAMERGEPLYPLISRWQYTWLQARLGYGLIIVPMGLILGWMDMLEWAHARVDIVAQGWWAAAAPLGVLVVLLVTPGIMTWVWPTTVLGPGPTRDALTEVCRRERVRIRRILVWQSHGGLATAGVFGVLPRLRYVLFGDAAIDLMNTPTLVAIMAHEVAHVRRRHLPWLLAMIGAAFGVTTLAAREAALPGPQETLLVLAIFAAAVGAIAWACRRFEWQADAMAAVHMTRLESEGAGATVVSAEGAGAMVHCLSVAAQVNGLDVERWTPWHGSIAQRQRRLRELVGRPIDALPIDRAVRWIKRVTGGLLLAGVAGALAAGGVW